jgi:protein SCO1/2
MESHRHRGFVTRATAWVLVAAVAAGLGLWLGTRSFAPHAATTTADTPPPPALKAARLFSSPRTLPPFALDTVGGTLTPADLRGHWTIVFLGFTHCPDVCPTTLQQMAQAQAAWRTIPAPQRPQLWFVSVDPARDTPDALQKYAAFFAPDTRVATAAEPALADFAQSLGMVYMKVPTQGGDYTMEHSASLVLLDPQGRQAGLIRPPLDPAAIATDLAALAQAAP